MLKFTDKNKGSISIFLCIILLPMMIYSMMIIDASRLQACKTQLQSAGDLTMNAAMSEYEKILEDMYGLFAISDDPSELQPALENYFYETISGALNSDAETDSYVQTLARELTDLIFTDGMTEDDITNFMYMQLDEFMYEPVPESRISNPLVLKSQIIDYMKYKGPVSLANNLLTKIGLLKDSANQASAAEKEIEYKEALSNLNDPLKEVWNAINAYNTIEIVYETDVDPEIAYSKPENIRGIVDRLNRNTGIVWQNAALQNQYDLYYEKKVGYTHSVSLFDALPTSAAVTTILNHIDENDPDNLRDAKNLMDSIITKLCVEIVNPEPIDSSWTAAQFAEKYDVITVTFDTDEPTTVKKIEFTPKTTYSDNTYYASYYNVKNWNAGFYNDLFPLSDDQDQVIMNFYDDQISLLDHLAEISDYKAYYEVFQILKDKYVRLYDQYSDRFDEDEASKFTKYYNLFIMLDNEWEQNDHLKEYKIFLNNYLGSNYWYNACSPSKPNEEFINYYNFVKQLYNSLVNLEMKLTALLDKYDTVETAASTWNTEIDKVKDSTTKSQMKNNYDSATNAVKKSDVEALKNLVTPIREGVQKLLLDIESVKLLDIDLWKDDYHFTGVRASSYLAGDPDNKRDSEIVIFTISQRMADGGVDFPGQETLIKPYAYEDNGFISVVSPNVKKNEIINGIHDNNATESEEEVLYYALKNMFGEDADKNKETLDTDNKKNLETIKKNAKVSNVNDDSDNETSSEGEKDKGEKDKGNKSAGGKASEVGAAYSRIEKNNTAAKSTDEEYGSVQDTSIPSAGDDYSKSAEGGKNSLSAAKALLKQIGSLAENLRDDVYLEEYFTELFTCSTDKKLKPGELKLINGYSNIAAGSAGIYKPLNVNNEWYGKEIEYILWGDSNLDSNVKKTEGYIFLIRFALNAIYAFTASDIQGFASSVATATVGWSVVLVPIVQVCITLAIALAESTMDLTMLMDGEGVVIIKDSTTFICSPSGALAQASKKLIEEATEKAAEYVENKINSAIDSVTDLADKKISDCTDTINEVVNEYADELQTSIETAIKDQIVSPLINSVTPILNKLDDEKKNAENLINEKIEEAWTNIDSTISSMSDNVTKDMARQFFDSLGGAGKEEIKKILKNNIDKTNISTQDINKAINNYINGKLTSFKSTITSKVKEYTDKMKNEIMSHANEAATNLKSYVNGQITEISSDISGRITSAVTSTIQEHVGDVVTAVDTSAAGKLTLNYKEYCKIFMFIKLMSNSGETACLLRAASLIEVNVKHAVNNANASFDMTKAYTLVYVGANVRMNTLFPWAVSVTTDDTGTEGGASLDLSNLGSNTVKIGYSGLNGF